MPSRWVCHSQWQLTEERHFRLYEHGGDLPKQKPLTISSSWNQDPACTPASIPTSALLPWPAVFACHHPSFQPACLLQASCPFPTGFFTAGGLGASSWLLACCTVQASWLDLCPACRPLVLWSSTWQKPQPGQRQRARLNSPHASSVERPLSQCQQQLWQAPCPASCCNKPTVFPFLTNPADTNLPTSCMSSKTSMPIECLLFDIRP